MLSSGMANRTSPRKILIFEDDERQEDGDELNPFSFKEFVRSKNLTSICGGDAEQQSQLPLEKTESESMLVEEVARSSLKHCAPHLLDPSLDNSASFLQSTDDERKEWRGSHETLAVQEAHDFELCVTVDNECTDPLCVSTEEMRHATVLSQLDRAYLQEAFEPTRSPPTRDRDQETPMDGSRDLHKLREENAQLKNHVKKLLKKSESDNQRIRELTEQLQKQKEKEEREAQALESMVQSVELNLQKMTKRAVKAETSASKLKQELLQLQDQLEVYRSDNERLRAAETTALNAVKQNAQIASEYLSKAANNAQTSIRQLLSDAETISLVSKMLYSIDKISDAR